MRETLWRRCRKVVGDVVGDVVGSFGSVWEDNLGGENTVFIILCCAVLTESRVLL